MPRTHAERKHENQHESRQQQNQRRHIRDPPKQGNCQVLQKELSKDAAIHRNLLFSRMGNVKILERHEEWQIHSQQRHAYRKTQQLRPKRGNRNEKPPKNQRGRKQDNSHTPEQECHEVRIYTAKIKTKPILFAPDRNRNASQQQDNSGQQNQIPHHHRNKIRIWYLIFLFRFNTGLFRFLYSFFLLNSQKHAPIFSNLNIVFYSSQFQHKKWHCFLNYYFFQSWLKKNQKIWKK